MKRFIQYASVLAIVATAITVASEAPVLQRPGIEHRTNDETTIRERMAERREARQSKRAERRENIKGQVQERRGNRASDMTQLCLDDPMNQACTEQPLD